MDVSQTQETTVQGERAKFHAPGLLQVWSPPGPEFRAISLERPVVLGRDADVPLADRRASRHHCRVSFDRNRWIIEDMDSRNGTFVAGALIVGQQDFTNPPSPLRVGNSLFLAVPDITPFGDGVLVEADCVVGANLAAARRQIALIAQQGSNLLIVGPSGAGKELAAKYFHRMSPKASGPIVEVNCAAIPEGVAERLLFGTTKGAYSGATEAARGYIQAARGGTLFLDEIGELDMAVQGKLLRVLETREVCSLGSTRNERVDFQACFATNRDLRSFVQQKKFREDFFFRINNATVEIPPLNQRLEEIPFLVQRAAGASSIPVEIHCTLVEACLLRLWPGNIRELLAEVHGAIRRAILDGRTRVEASDLGLLAGMSQVASELPPPRTDIDHVANRQRVEAALESAGGNIAQAARALQVHRTQFCRWMNKYGITR